MRPSSRLLIGGIASLASLLHAPSARAAGDLRIVSATPQGKLDDPGVSRIQILFNAPVVPLGAPEPADAPPPWLEVSPAMLARWRWAGTSTLVAEPKGPLPGATTYSLRVRAGLASVDGRKLGDDFAFSFSTPAPSAIVIADPGRGQDPIEHARWSRAAGVPPRLDPGVPVVLVWNQPVDDGSVAQHLALSLAPRPAAPSPDAVLSRDAAARLEKTDREGRAAFEAWSAAVRGPAAGPAAFVVEPDADHPHRVYRVAPKGSWPRAAELTVTIAEGTRGLEGPDPGAASRTVFHSPWPLAPVGIAGRRSREGPELDPADAAIAFSSRVSWAQAAGFVRLRASGSKEWRHAPAAVAEEGGGEGERLALDPFSLDGGTDYEVCVDRGLEDLTGDRLGFPWCATFRTAHRAPAFHVVEGNGVLEWNGPHRLPLSSVNVTGYAVEHRRLAEEELVPALRVTGAAVAGAPAAAPPAAAGVALELPVDRWTVWPLELDAVLGGKPGVVLSRLAVRDVVPGSEYDANEARWLREPRVAFTQVTSLGLTAKVSQHEGILVWVTRLDRAEPVAGAAVAVRDRDNRVIWQGTTDASGLTATGPEISESRAFLVTARVGDDLAYTGAGWAEGHRGWDFNLPVDGSPGRPVVGAVWADRGIARAGETIHLKAALRRPDERRLRLLAGKQVTFVVRDALDQDVAVRKASLDAWGGAEIALDVPSRAPLGNWQVKVGGTYDEGKRQFAADLDWSAGRWEGGAPPVAGSFRVAEFRRPKFRVRVTIPPGNRIAGDPLAATVEGAYLAGGPMTGATASWTVRWRRSYWEPSDPRWDGWSFLDETFLEPGDTHRQEGEIAKGEGKLDARGGLAIAVPRVEAAKGFPARVEVESDVEDVDRRTSADADSTLVLPGEFFVGLKRAPYFVQAKDGVAVEVVALDPDSRVLAGKSVSLALVRRHWESVRRRDVAGRYVFESRPVDETVAEATVTTGSSPEPHRFDPREPGEYSVYGRAKDARGNELVSGFSFYVLGPGYTPWRFDQENRIDLVAERPSYAPGDTARVLVKSPWERALALVTVERAGVLETRLETLTGTMPVLEIPVRDEYAPNVFVSAVLLRGRVDVPADPEMVDPGRPAYRVGYCELTVPPRGKRLAVEVAASRAEYRPGDRAGVTVRVAGAAGAPRAASVTVWAVDAGVLALTRYPTPDLMAAFYARQGIGVATVESRSRLVGRRTYGTKGDRTGGGGGAELGDREIRKDFRALAVWRGDVVTGDDGTASLEFVLPDSLTTYRLMAVAMAGAEEFGSSEVEFRVTKPVGLEPALPRFLRPGDRARAGVVVRNRTGDAREVEVRATAVSGPVRVEGEAARRLTVPAGGSAEVSFDLSAAAPGEGSLRFDASSPAPSPERDALELPLRVSPIAAKETVATFLRVSGRARETVDVPADAWPEAGALEVRLSRSEMLAAKEGVRFLVEYPHGCAEQIASRVLGVAAALKLGAPLAPEEVAGLPTPAWLRDSVDRLLACQKPDGGFSYWSEGRLSSPSLSAHVAWALAAAGEAGAPVPARALERAAGYLSAVLRDERAPLGRIASWTQRVSASFALDRLGKPEPPYYQGLFDARGPDAPLWGRALLATAMIDASAADPRAAQLLQEVRNRITVEARFARLEEPSPDWGWIFWWSEPRGSAIALMALASADPSDPTADRVAGGLLDRLARGARRETQETAWMLQSLARYEAKRGGGAGPRRATASLAGKVLVEGRFDEAPRGEAAAAVPMSRLRQIAKSAGSTRLPLEFATEGSGDVHASAVLTYAPKGARPPLSEGVSVETAIRDARGQAVTGAAAGEDLTVEVTVAATAIRRFLAVEVPIPAGIELFDPGLATTGSRGRVEVEEGEEAEEEECCFWEPGFDHVEIRDDRLVLYATELPAGRHAYRVKARATVPGRFAVAPARAEEMYAPEVFGTSSGGSFEVLAGRD